MIIHNTWRLLDSGIKTAQCNMAIDEALLNCFKEGDMPIMRLYGWENALSVGRYSTLWTSLDQQTVLEENIPCVRRMSGGGILVHGGDLSYSLIMPRDWLREKGVKESYHYLCAFLLHLYEKLGYKADFSGENIVDELQSDICLTGNEVYDIVIDGKKMGGNAQRHTRHVLFQHGSIPMGIDEPFFKPFFRLDPGFENAATLERLGTSISYKELATLVREIFCETFGVKLVPGSLSESEERQAKELLADKYSQERWNLHG
ncbi:MAG: lipoate--protein ligase family protein [Sulfuricurvum sp.]|nr:lipoate--protein ligase family protein [Sulfuricurvum sp.]